MDKQEKIKILQDVIQLETPNCCPILQELT